MATKRKPFRGATASARVMRSAPVMPNSQVRRSDAVGPVPPMRSAFRNVPANVFPPSPLPVDDTPADPAAAQLAAAQVAKAAEAAAMRTAVEMARSFPTREELRGTLQAEVPEYLRRMDRLPPTGDLFRKFLGFQGDAPVWRDLEPPVKFKHHFKGTYDAATTNLHVTPGTWTRNGISVALAPDAGATFASVAVGDDSYVWLALTATGEADPGTAPEAVELQAGSSKPEDAEKNTAWLLGKMTAGAWDQWWTGGDIDDWLSEPATGGELPDAETPYDNMEENPPVRRTIEHNPTEGVHQGELQLFDVDEVGENCIAVAAFARIAGSVDERLVWAHVDADSPIGGGLVRSLDIGWTEDDMGHRTYGMGIYGFAGASDQQFMACRAYAVGGILTKSVDYYYPMLIAGSPNVTGSGAGPVGSASYAELLSNTGLEFTLVDQSLKLSYGIRRLEVADGRGNVAGETSSEISISLSGVFTPADHTHSIADGDITDWATEFTHAKLNDMPSADNGDHDGRYWPSQDYAMPDGKGYATSGVVRVGRLGLWEDTSHEGKNDWSTEWFNVEITGDISLKPGGAVKINEYTGWSGTFQVVDANGDTRTMTVHKGFVVGVGS